MIRLRLICKDLLICKDKAKEKIESQCQNRTRQANSLLKPVITMYIILLLLHKHGEHDDTSTQGAQQQGWGAHLERQRELLVHGEHRSASDSVYCSSLVLSRFFICVNVRDLNRVLTCQKPCEDRLILMPVTEDSRSHSVPGTELTTKTVQGTWGCWPKPLQQPPHTLPSLA